MKLTFTLTQEHVDLLCAKLGYTPTIMINTGEVVDGKPIMVEKPISQDDFLYNYYAGMIDGDALVQKQSEARTAALESIPAVQLATKQASKIPTVTQQEINDAKLALEPVEEIKP